MSRSPPFALALMVVVLGTAACTRPNDLWGTTTARPDAPADVAADVGPADGPGPDRETAAAEVPVVMDGPVPVDGGLDEQAPPDSSTPADASMETARDAAIEAMQPAGLIGWWKLDETSGDRAFDSSGNGHHGMLEGFTGSGWVSTSRGGGLRFPNGINTGVGIRVGAQGAVPPVISGLRQFTIAAWTNRADNLGVHQSLMSRQYLDADSREVFNLAVDGADAILYVLTNPPERTWDARATMAPADAMLSKWVHVAATYDGRDLLVYVNGVVGSQPRAYSGELNPSPMPLYIGTNKNTGTPGHQPFQGILDEVLLFSRALDGPAITRLMNGVLPAR